MANPILTNLFAREGWTGTHLSNFIEFLEEGWDGSICGATEEEQGEALATLKRIKGGLEPDEVDEILIRSGYTRGGSEVYELGRRELRLLVENALDYARKGEK